MGMMSKATKKGEKMFGWLICIKSTEEKMNSSSMDGKKRKNSQDQGEKKKKRRKRKLTKIFCTHNMNTAADHENQTPKKRKPKKFWRKKSRSKANNLASLVNTMSFRSDSGKHRSAAEEILRIGNNNIAAPTFTFRELAAATKNFNSDNLLGEGGFGRVYKGQLKDTNEIVAVKQLDRNGFQGNREFLVEVLMLSLLHHPNLVKLLGYCADGDQRILVYEYMELGSLEDHLLVLSPNSKRLDWHTRMKIAADAARGLEYLHDTANPPVIYRDFKASNILLDNDYNAKLSDFGLAKVGPVGDKSHVSTRVMGTYGYCAPEYALTGQLTKMSDVYSFGVVFLELITGRRAIDTTRPAKEQQLVRWAEPLFKDKRKFAQMADPLLEGKYPMKGLYQALAVAAMCLQHEAPIRPLMRDVVTALEFLANPDCAKEPIPPSVPLSSSESAQKDTRQTAENKLESDSINSSAGSFSSREQKINGGSNNFWPTVAF